MQGVIGSTRFQPNRLYHLHPLLCLMGPDGPGDGGDGPGTLQGIIASSESPQKDELLCSIKLVLGRHSLIHLYSQQNLRMNENASWR